MNKINRLSGAESAARIIGAARWESPCGFGTCAGHIDCRDTSCPEHPVQTGLVGLPVIDMKFLEEESLNARLRNSCMNDRLRDLPIEFADEDEGIGQFLDGIERSAKRFKNIAIAVLAGLLIGAVIYAATK